MNRSSLKSGIFLITYGIVLYLVLSHIGLVAGAGSYIMTVLRPVIIGVVMAYVINLLMRPMETKWLAGLWRRCPRLARGKRGLCIVLSILGVLAIITALCLFILPQVGESLLSLANNIPGYITDAGDFFNGLESRLDMENEVISYLWKLPRMHASMSWPEINPPNARSILRTMYSIRSRMLSLKMARSSRW